MHVQWKLFADLAEAAGGHRKVTVDVGADATVGDALDALLDDYPELEERVLDDGALRDHINVLRNGTNVRTEAGLDTAVDGDDELALFPPVSGGDARA